MGRGGSRNDKWIKEISLHLNYNDVCDLILAKSKKIYADNKDIKYGKIYNEKTVFLCKQKLKRDYDK